MVMVFQCPRMRHLVLLPDHTTADEQRADHVVLARRGQRLGLLRLRRSKSGAHWKPVRVQALELEMLAGKRLMWGQPPSAVLRKPCPEPWTVLTVSGGQKQGQSYEAKYRLQPMKWLQKQALPSTSNSFQYKEFLNEFPVSEVEGAKPSRSRHRRHSRCNHPFNHKCRPKAPTNAAIVQK
jgi:hypothetical protein